MPARFSNIINRLKPISGIIYFVVILLLSHFIWKFSIKSNDSETVITWFGYDISTIFNLVANHIAKLTHNILQGIGMDVQLDPHNVIRHTNNKQAVWIVWSCTGLKQAYIFICIILFYKGCFKHKLWFIPLGLLIIYVFNIFRISFITALVGFHPEWFGFMHEHFFKYLFYALIFGIWVFWEEKFVLKKHNT